MSQLEFLSFVTIWVFNFFYNLRCWVCQNLSFWFLTQFEFLIFVTIQVFFLSQFELLSFVTIWVFEFSPSFWYWFLWKLNFFKFRHNLNIWFLSLFRFFEFSHNWIYFSQKMLITNLSLKKFFLVNIFFLWKEKKIDDKKWDKIILLKTKII